MGAKSRLAGWTVEANICSICQKVYKDDFPLCKDCRERAKKEGWSGLHNRKTGEIISL